MHACTSWVELDSVYPNLTPAIKEFLFFTHFLNSTIFSYPLCILLTLGLSVPVTWFFLKKPDFLLSFLEKLLNSSFSEFACIDKDKCPEYQLIQLAKKVHKLSGTKSPL